MATPLADIVYQLCKRNQYCSSKFQDLQQKDEWTLNDKKKVLALLTELFVQPTCTEDVTHCSSTILLDLVERVKNVVQETSEQRITMHQMFCIALSKAVTVCPSLKRFFLCYLKSSPPFLHTDHDIEQPKSKKLKLDPSHQPLSETHLDLVQTAYRCVVILGKESEPVVSLEHLLPFLTFSNKDVQWFAVQTLATLLQMSARQKDIFIRHYFQKEEIVQLSLRYRKLLLWPELPRNGLTANEQQLQVPTYIADNGLLSSKVVSVSGVLLPKLVSNQQMDQTCKLIPVASTMKNLQSLAEAVVLGKPVLLQGPVGSGKTCLVETLAQMTGRHKSPQLLKLQLGDQTDSRALVGIYQCTDIPGEFVWQPGVLTRAVSEGYWVLLEDIDRAPMDVISLLLPLLETNTLMIPNRGQRISASPGFQLFATLRVFPGTGALNSLKGGMSVLLEKSWTKVNVEPLSKDELYQLISQKYPSLQSIINRLLEIYFLLSRGEHAGTMEVGESKSFSFKFLSTDKRLISTRDLLNWCKRILSHDLTSSAITDLVFQETLDCYCFSISCPIRRLQMAEAMGAKLNVAKTKAEYYCMKYKPALQVTENEFTIGRVAIPRRKQKFHLSKSLTATSIPFSFTRQSTALLEKVSACVLHNEPILLVGETGTGKTSTIQYLAHQLKHKLHIINMNQQSDGTDLLGGFKPVDLKHVVNPFKESFEELFCKTFSRKQNIVFLTHIENCFSKKAWKDLLALFEHTIKSAVKNQAEHSEMWKLWKKQERKLKQMQLQIQRTENAMAFAFVEGTLVKALRNGDWILLDEINLATAETLECLTGLLESQSGSVVLSERGDVEAITRHPNFRLFACMNPATDVGKKSLTPSLRNRFMEFFVDELNEPQDLKILVNDYLTGLSPSPSQIDGLVNFYLQVQRVAGKQLTDGTGHKPHYSLRTFCRSLMCSSLNPARNVTRSLYECVCMSFLTQLDRSSYPIVEQLACRYLLEKNDPKSFLKRPMPEPSSGKHVHIEGYWIPLGPCEVNVSDKYILTPSVRANLKDLARIVAIGRHPVLLQGETSVGKTSLIQWLASSTGNKCVRINNHEHTDLQEYLGTYTADSMGKLVFKEGILVQAMRQGFWIILDELNLAPTDVLEALNRLLDDNRELFIPETQEMVKAHPKFMLFATQNPPGLYGGRKTLSRAFRNRFIELHFDEIPSTELETILSQRCDIPLSYGKKLVKVMLELQTRRSSSGIFAGKHGFMTLRDLFRWADRYHCPGVDTSNYDWDQHMADHGFMLLAGKMRKPEEEDIVQEALQKYFRRKVTPDCLFNVTPEPSPTTAEMLRKLTGETIDNYEHIFWTPNMQRLAVLVGQAMKYKEPVLLVGETGCGKTTICQLYAAMNETELFTVNCHSNTESADFLGGLRPVRSHEDMIDGDQEQSQQKLFEWVDGPLVKAMDSGCPFLIDEISLAEDSVLERLNSVLEPERTLLLAEKGIGHQETVPEMVAEEKFCIFATMNPGGDFGKKELSPALRNRFTEIWCPQIASPGDMVSIIQHNLQPNIRFSERPPNGDDEEEEMDIANAMMTFTEWFVCTDFGKKCVVSIRDILCWVHFMNTCSLSYEDEDEYMDVSKVDPCISYVHGACLVFLDSLGTGSTSQIGRDSEVHSFRDECLQFLLWQVNVSSTQKFTLESLELMDRKHVYPNQIVRGDSYFTVPPFSIPVVESGMYRNENYAFHAPTTYINTQRMIRGLQLSRPILLEGSPGVGKTSLVAAIAAAAGRELVRINLSEQTDIADLFGSDLPVEGGEGGVFCWRDGPFLQALKAGHWIILDELNLASQSVLEGLNACLDHRGEVFVPELGKTFYIQHANTRIFGCQNPYHQGSGRKGLPKSFLNRFTKVYIDALSRGDLQLIANTMFPSIPEKLLSNMVHFNMKIHSEVVSSHSWGHKGGPWEFNLRDLFRWCELLIENQPPDSFDPGEYLNLIYIDRMQTQTDRDHVVELYQRTFSCIAPIYRPSGLFSLSLDWVQCGHSFLPRPEEHSMPVDVNKNLKMLPCMLPVLESVMKCVQMNWLTILIGEPGSGKTSTIQMLADLTGNNLQILPMNSSMDTTELLGGFEQIDISCHIEEVSASIKLSIDSLSRKLLPLHHFTDVESNLACIHHMWHKYCRGVQKHQSAHLTSTEEVRYMKKQLTDLKVILAQLLDLSDEESDELLELDIQLNSLKETLVQLENTTNGNVFEWINSILVKALLSGDWLLIDNVNFCSASVLDRLNALLEPSGVLTVSERGVIDGEIPEIVPHPNFRLFFTMDPKYGNISRAMRNRGIEIFILNKSDKKVETIDIDVSNSGDTNTVAQLPLSSLPLAHQYCSHPLLTQAQHLVSVYIQVLRQLLSSQYSCPNVSTSRWPLISFIHLVSNHVHSQNWKFCSELISPLLTEVQLEVNCSEMSTFGGWKAVCGQHDLPELTQVTLVALFDHPLKEILQNYLDSMKTSNNSAEILMRGPYDFRWNRQALHKMISTSKSESNATICLFDQLTGVINRIRLSQVLTVEWQLSQEKVKKWEVLCEGAQHLGTEKSAHLEVFVYIDNVLVLLRQELRAAFTEQGDCSDKQFYQIYCGLAWLNRLLDVALQHLEKDLSPPTEAKLSLIWNWTFYKLLMPLLGHNSPLKLSDKIEKVINHIHKLLSDQNSASKLFKKMLAGWGNPQPFFSEQEYNQWKKLDDLAKHIEIFGRGKNQQRSHTIEDILKLDRTSITDQFLQLISEISSKSAESDLFESLFKDLENKINSVSSIADDNAEETSEMSSVDSIIPEAINIKQQLWPLYEHTVLAVERRVLNLLLEQQEPQLATWLPHLIEFMKQHLPVSPLNLAEYQKLFTCLGQGNSKIFYSSIFLCYYLHWWQNSVNSLNTDSKSSEINLFSPDVKGPGIAVSSCLSEILNKLISNHVCTESVNNGSVHFLSDTSILLPQVGIGHHKDTAQLFSQIRNHLWVHTAPLSGPQFSGKNIEQKNILETLQHTLTAIGLSLPQFCDSDIPDLHVLTNQSGIMNPYHFTEKLEIFVTQIKECSYFDDVVITLTKKAITSVQEMLTYDEPSSVMHIGSCLVLVGLLQSYLLGPRGHLDPVERDKLKLSHGREDLEMISLELDMENVFAELMTGRSFADTCHNQLHPHIIWLMEHREKLTNKVHCLQGRTAYRPDVSLFPMLKKDYQNFLQTGGSCESILSLLHKAKTLESSNTAASGNTSLSQFIQEVHTWQRTMHSFIQKMQDNYSIYKDILTPFYSSLHRMSHGFGLIVQTLQVTNNRNQLAKLCDLPKELEYSWLEDIYVCMSKFPSCSHAFPDLLKLSVALTSDLSLHLSQTLMSKKIEKLRTSQDQKVFSQLLLSGLLHLKNHVLSSQQLSLDVLGHLSAILDLFVSAWRKREEEKKKLEQEKESLYRFKTVYHDSGPDDERLGEEDFQQRFPNFQKDFLDLMPSELASEKVADPEESKLMDDSTENDDSFSLMLSKEEMKEIYSIHHQLFTVFTKPLHWMISEQGPKDPGTGVDLLKPFFLTYKTITSLSSELANCWHESYDNQVVGGHLLVTAALEEVISRPSFAQLGVVQNPVVDHCYDVYRDANITEIIQCEPVIRRLLQKLHQLQEEWPDHPALKQLETIANRILSFPLTSPIMKVLSGLELLLHKAQDWESVAAKHVSLEAELHDISNLIVDWRKFELSYWKNSLDITFHEVEIEASRWWFHLYQLVFAFIQPAPETDTSKPASDLEKEIIASLKQFLENSNLGEFKVRLRIVYAFHCQLANIEPTPKQKLLMKLLWNIHEFYKQFLPAVESEIEHRRIPIEKELKGFVKIARWSDINYWALRQATEKTHRTVHKHITTFKKVLLESVKTVLVKSSAIPQQPETKELLPEMWLQTLALVGDCNLDASSEICLPDTPEGSLLSRLPTLLHRLNKHYMNFQKKMPYPKMLLAFDEFTCEVIEGIEERKTMTVKQSADLEKKKKEAKHINLKQRQGLANLYRHLAKIGLSYKKGLIRSEEDHGDAFLYINPVDIQATVQTVGTTSLHHGPVFKNMWISSQQFYLNCLSHHNQLKTILQNPEAKDFGLANIDRCRGFSEHMKQILLDQHCMLAKLSDNYFELRKILTTLKCPSLHKSISLPPQNEFSEWLSSLEQVAVKCSQGLSQFQILLKCCPVSSQHGSCRTPLPAHTLPQTSFMSINDPTWNLCMEKVEEVLSHLKAIFKKPLAKLRNRTLYSWDHLYILESGYSRLRESLVPLQQIELMFVEPEYGSDSSFTECLTFLQSEIQASTDGFFFWYRKQNPDEISTLIKQCEGQPRQLTTVSLEEEHTQQESFDPLPDDNLLKDYFDDLIAKVLFPVQKLLENHKETEDKANKIKPETSSEKDTSSTESDTEIFSGHLTQHLHKMLFDDIKKLNCETLMQTINQVIDTLTSSWDHIVKSNRQQIASVVSMKSTWLRSLMSCLPMLELFSCLIENYLLYLLITHQISGKLYDGLLIHFIELATKGFYVLPEVSDSAQEGATQFDDQEGGGMGEGEGVKDVSDQIETEDQLEDVNQKDKQKPNQDSEEQPDIEPEDNAIEMSDDFEGKTHNPDEEFDENDESEDEAENDLDKKMGDIDSKEADKLDDQLWGSDEEEEDEEKSEEKEETGPGAGQDGDDEIVAKEDDGGDDQKSSKPNKDTKPEESETKEEDVEEKVNEPETMDQSECDDKLDPYHSKEEKQEEKAENLDLPDNLKLDEAEAAGDEEDAAPESPPAVEDAKTDELKETEESKESGDGDEEDKNNTSDKEDSSREDENQMTEDAPPMDVDDVEDGDEGKPDADEVDDGDQCKKEKIEEGKEEEGEESAAAPQIKDKKVESEEENMEDDSEAPEAQSDKFYGISEDQKQDAEQSELAQDTGGESNSKQQQQQQQAEGASAPSDETESFPSKSSTDVTKGSTSEGSQKPESLKPSSNDTDRSLGNKEEQYEKHMKTLQEVHHHSDTEQQEEDDDAKQNKKSDLYQHVSDSSSHYTQQMMDVATEKQQSNLPHYEDVEEDDDEDDDIESIKDSDDSYIEEDIDDDDDDDDDDVEMIESNIVRGNLGEIEEYVVDDDDEDEEDEEDEEEDDEDIVEEQDMQMQPSSVDLSGDKIMTAGASRPAESTIHTSMKYLDRDDLVDIEELRAEIEEQLSIWSNNQLYGNTVAAERQASDLWQLYEQVTGSLSQELCEQLRLILEPSRATKLKGDYRTGKRINMKKVIPYIASQFRKDKIWLRRTKPSKRDYQILLAIDDSSSMLDNHSKQLAFESLAVIANALSLLEVGDLSICSFGECVEIVHPFTEPFSCQSGSRLLQHFTFAQKKTNIAQLLQHSTSMLLETRQHHQGQISNPNLSQLLLIVSDGRGLFAEGVDFVKAAVRQAHSANIFVVFVVLDNPLNKDSILDIRIPIFKAAGQLPEIKSYMDHFPFPFYIILRDIDSLPQTLSDALRQWFELVTIEHQ